MKEITNVMLGYAKKNPWFLLSNVSFSFLIPIQDVVLPHLYGKVISAIEKNKRVIYPLTIVIIILSILQIGYVASDWHDTKLFPDLQAYIRKQMLRKMFENYETSFQDLYLGDIMSKFIKIPSHLTQCFERIKNYIAPYIVAYIIAVVYFMYNDVVLGVCLAFLITIYSYLVIGSPFFCKNQAVAKDTAQNILCEEIDDTLRNLISVYGSDQKEDELVRIDGYEKGYIKAYENTMHCALRTRTFATPIIIAFLSVFMWRCLRQLKANKMTASKFVPLFIILLYILNSMLALTDQVRDMIFEVGIISNFEDILSYKKTYTPTIVNPPPFTAPSGLVMYDVTFGYSKLMSPILNHFNLHISPGEKVAIVGEIGSGKSTVLKLLLKLHVPTQGEIYLNGIPYLNLPVRQIRKRIGYVPQQPILFNRTIIENIRNGNKKVTSVDIERIIAELGIQNEFQYLEHGLNTKIGKNGSKISGGQRQLVWCLRVLLNNPEILILDEPTASLDEKTKNLMKSMFDRFMHNRTVIMVTHDPSLMQYATRMIVMQKGQIV
jgi:ABC-type multidrug transport system fused ATPase/permease subunit